MTGFRWLRRSFSTIMFPPIKARDILVGKVPDPKSQVSQITIALIYQFMDDMDAEAEDMGGQHNFPAVVTPWGRVRLSTRSAVGDGRTNRTGVNNDGTGGRPVLE